MKLCENIRALMSARNVGTTLLSRNSGIPMPTLARILGGKVTNPQVETLQKIASSLGATVSDLLGESAPEASLESHEDYVAIRSLDLRLSAGPGAEAQYEDCVADKSVLYSREFFQALRVNPAHVVRMRVTGDSMEPLLNHNDYVLVNLNDRERILDRKVYAIRVDGDYRVKRLCKKLDGTIILISDNPRYEDERLTPELLETIDFKIIGRVLERSGTAAFE